MLNGGTGGGLGGVVNAGGGDVALRTTGKLRDGRSCKCLAEASWLNCLYGFTVVDGRLFFWRLKFFF